MNLEELQTTLDSWPIHAPLQVINDPQLDASGVRLYLKREDLIHPLVSGNKWRKLKYNLLRAKKEHYQTLLIFFWWCLFELHSGDGGGTTLWFPHNRYHTRGGVYSLQSNSSPSHRV